MQRPESTRFMSESTEEPRVIGIPTFSSVLKMRPLLSGVSPPSGRAE
mgnify:CR=1 FL=1